MKGVKAILLMAGSGTRFSPKESKQFYPLKDKPIYLWTLEALEKANLFEEIILVAPRESLSLIQLPHQIVPGKETRQGSSFEGIKAAGPATEILLIHDAVRPFVSKRILEDNIKIARKYGAADTCIPSTDTLVYAPNGDQIESIPPRSHYRRGQTPQTFSYPLIFEAHTQTDKVNATDDCQLILELGKEVHIVEGEERNIKITTKEDLKFAEAMQPFW
jgi:ribitol-5-phosphate 2-dehydrogenase (NADP+) / D-ribitol-5-phosphate cytidylyltransferase